MLVNVQWPSSRENSLSFGYSIDTINSQISLLINPNLTHFLHYHFSTKDLESFQSISNSLNFWNSHTLLFADTHGCEIYCRKLGRNYLGSLLTFSRLQSNTRIGRSKLKGDDEMFPALSLVQDVYLYSKTTFFLLKGTWPVHRWTQLLLQGQCVKQFILHFICSQSKETKCMQIYHQRSWSNRVCRSS